MSAENERGGTAAMTLRVIRGVPTGTALSAAVDSITVGRHPECDLRFDPEDDRAVSARHAVFHRDGTRWSVRDLGSTNGTFVNDRRITGDTVLTDGDRISFGPAGPAVEIILSAVPGPGTGTLLPEAPPTGERIRIAVARRTRILSALAAGLGVLLVLTALVALTAGERGRAQWDRERSAMLLQIDSVRWAGTQARIELEGQLAALTSQLLRSEEHVRALEAAVRLAESHGSPDEARELRLQLQAASATLHDQQSAASLDFHAIQTSNRAAVALIFVEMPNGEISTATAFAVRPDATLLTSKHVVAGSQGRSRPSRIAIQFSDSDQVWPARVLAVASDADIAVVKVDNILGDVPIVRGFNTRPDTLAASAPVATLGFAHGGEPQVFPPGRGGVARPILSAGVIQNARSEQIEVLGYGAVGASGSPIMDANGDVVGVVYGGRNDPDGHTLVGVPAGAIERLLNSIR